jgi:signal transduction histidine kinase
VSGLRATGGHWHRALNWHRALKEGFHMTGERNANAIARQQWKILLRNLPGAIVGNAACCVMMGAAVFWYGGGAAALVWTAIGLGIAVLRYVLWAAGKRGAVGGRGRGRTLIIVTTVAAGLHWGLALPTILPPGEDNLLALTGVFAAGLIAGSMALAAAVPAVFIAFTGSLTGPLALWFLVEPTVLRASMAAAVVVFSGIMISTALNMARQTHEVLAMRLAKTRMIRDLATERDRAAASDKAKSRFLATMSHELRTPLNIILGFAETIEKRLLGPLGDERYAEYATTIRESGEHLLALINDVLDLSRVGAGQYVIDPDEVELDPLLTGLRRGMSEQAAKAQVTLFSTVEPDLPPVWADRRALRQILLNLLSNAIKFTGAGGHVQVSATLDREPGFIRVTVTDTGVGIPEAQQAKVLQPFVQADSDRRRRFQGTGLGLALSKELAELLGGDLSLASEEGVGTTVTVRLPRASEAWATEPAPAAPTEETPEPGPTDPPAEPALGARRG